ncbi:sensor histidine kinase [Bifidobacterium simiiventris]|uniref:sensor histidine kinase n=1 Tax=Bifidobacterium simiiventris TaxID=2834434 RepID=UPI001C5873AA|nr:histidine kinase [Bifidobacterium simiiventris]MBW3078031.1 hypothetical protein [Bifidobacterium simiiventris]
MTRIPNIMTSALQRYQHNQTLAILCTIVTGYSLLQFSIMKPENIWQWSVAIIQSLTLMTLPCIPVISGYAEITLFAILLASPSSYGRSILEIGVCFVLGLFAYIGRPRHIIFPVVLAACTLLWHNYLLFRQWTTFSLMNMGLTFIFAAMSYVFGFILHVHEENERLAIRQRQQDIEYHHIRQAEQQLLLARDLHDSITGDLTGIILLAQQNIDDGTTQDPRLTDIMHLSEHALRNIRTMISTLSETTHADHPASKHAWTDIRRSIGEGQENLKRHGFTGHIDISVDASPCIEDATGTEIVHLITEIFANILRHGSAESNYYMIVTENDDAVTITQTNTVKEKMVSNLPASGEGLRMHHMIITSLGGELRFNSEDNEWTLYALIPLHHGSYPRKNIDE